MSYLVCCFCRNPDTRSESFSSLNQLEEHLSACHHGNNCLFDCNLCPKDISPGFLTDISLQVHIQRVHNDQQNQMDQDVTDLKLKVDKQLNDSISAAFADTRCLCCQICLKEDDMTMIIYSSLLELEKHIAESHCKKFRVCSLCPARFYTRDAELQHFKADHKDQDQTAAKFGIYQSLNNSVKMSLDASQSEPRCSRGIKREHIDDSRCAMVAGCAVATNSGNNNLNSGSVQVVVKSEQTSQNTVPVQQDNNEQTTQEDNREHEQTSTGGAMAAAPPGSGPGQYHNVVAADQFYQNDLPNHDGQPALTNNQSAPLVVFNQQTDLNQESTGGQEVLLNVDLSHHTSASEPSVVPQEPVQARQIPLKQRLRNQKRPNYGDSDIGTDRHLKNKRSRVLRAEKNLPQVQRGKSVSTTAVDGQNRQQQGLVQNADENEANEKIVKNKTRARKHMEKSRDESDDNDVQSNFRQNSFRHIRKVNKSDVCRLCNFTTRVPLILNEHIKKHNVVSKLFTATSQNNTERNMRAKPGKKG